MARTTLLATVRLVFVQQTWVYSSLTQNIVPFLWPQTRTRISQPCSTSLSPPSNLTSTQGPPSLLLYLPRPLLLLVDLYQLQLGLFHHRPPLDQLPPARFVA